MPTYQRKDHFYYKAKEQGLPSRASFKLEEILKKFKLITPGDITIDLGAAPGGWAVILSQAVGPKGKVFAIDLEPLQKVSRENLFFFQGDINHNETTQWLNYQLTKKANLVCSDMSPKLSGITFRDAYQSYELCEMALKIAEQYLKAGGHFVTKIFPGEEFPVFLKKLKTKFTQVKTFEPEATRKTSKEIYLVGIGFRS